MEMFRVFLEGPRSEKIPTLDPDVDNVYFPPSKASREPAGYDRFDGHGVDVYDIFYWEYGVGTGKAQARMRFMSRFLRYSGSAVGSYARPPMDRRTISA